MIRKNFLTCCIVFVISLNCYSFQQDSIAIDRDDKLILDLFDINISDILNVDIISASQKKQSVLEAPANAYIITSQQIQQRGYTNLLELLMDIPQVELQLNADPEYRNTVTLRGVTGNEKLLILLNGNRLTPSTGDFYTLGQQFMITHAERVEVIVGPASALYGVDAFSGIVNIITKTAGANDDFLEVQSGYGNFSTMSTALTYGINRDKVSFTVSGTLDASEEPNYHQMDEYMYGWYNWQFQPFGRVLKSQDSPSIYLAESFENDAGDSFWGKSVSRDFDISSSASSFFAELRIENFSVGYQRMVESHSSALGVDSRYTSFDGNAQIKTIQDAAYLTHRYVSFDNRLSFETMVSLNRFEIDPQSHYLSAKSLWQRGYIYSNSFSGKIQEQIQFQPNKKWNLTAGASVESLSSLPRTALIPRPYDKTQPLASQELYYIGGAGFLPLLYEDTNKPYIDIESYSSQTTSFNDNYIREQDIYYTSFSNLGTYLQAIFSPSRLLDITLSSRYDVNSRYGSSINPRVGIVYHTPGKKLYLKGMYGESFLAPSPAKAYRQDGIFYGNLSRQTSDPQDAGTLYTTSYHIANPDLWPEKLRTAEFNVSGILGQSFSVSANVFNTQIEDFINLFSTDIPEDLQLDIYSDKVTISRNQGNLNVYGATIGLTFFMNSDLGRINLYSYYSYVDGEQVLGNKQYPLLYQSKHAIKSGADIQKGAFSISLRNTGRSSTLGVSERLDSNPPLNVTDVYSSLIINDGRFWKSQLFGEVKNVFNATYFNVYYGSLEGMPRILQDPLRYQVGLKINVK